MLRFLCQLSPSVTSDFLLIVFHLSELGPFIFHRGTVRQLLASDRGQSNVCTFNSGDRSLTLHSMVIAE